MAHDVQTTPPRGTKGPQGHHKSAIARLGERLTKSVTQMEADELREDGTACVRIGERSFTVRQAMLDAAKRVVQHHAEQDDGRQAAARANGPL